MKVHDYNGAGRWSSSTVIERYRNYCQELGVSSPRDLSPKAFVQDDVKRIYPVMDEVIAGIEHGDSGCVEIGIEFVEEDQHFPFGKVLKSNTARALRRAELSSVQTERLGRRIVNMLISGSVPHEFKEYAKLLRKIGLGEWWPTIERRAPRDNRYVMRYYRYFQEWMENIAD